MINSLTLQHHIGPFLGEVFMGIVNCIFTVLGKPIDEKDEQVMLSFHNITKFEKWCDQLVTSMGQRKKFSTEIEPIMWQEIFAGSNFCGFCGFSSNPRK